VAVFDRFDSQKDRCTTERRTEHSNKQLMLFELCRSNGPRHRQRTKKENPCVDRTKLFIEEPTAKLENLWVSVAVERICTKHSAKEKNFGNEEQPHSKLSRIELLFSVIEVVRKPCRMVVMMILSVLGFVCGLLDCSHFSTKRWCRDFSWEETTTS